MPRERTNQYWLIRIADLMINEGLKGQPSAIAATLEWEDEQLDEGNPLKGTYPLLPTVKKYMTRVNNPDSPEGIDAHNLASFEWPKHIGNGEDQVPREHERYALDAVAYYIKNFDVRPMLSLIKWVAWVAANTQGANPQSQAVIAEKFWYAERVSKMPNRERPSTDYEYIQIAMRWWESTAVKDWQDYVVDKGLETLWIPLSDRLFINYMPSFKQTLTKYEGGASEQ